MKFVSGGVPCSRVLFCSRYEPLKQTWLSPRLEAAREPRVVWSVQRVSEEGQPLSRAMPTEKWFLMQTVFVQYPVSHALAAHFCVCAHRQTFSSFSSRVTKNNQPHASFLTYHTSSPCQIWTQPPIPALSHSPWFTSRRIFPQQTIHTWK